MGTKYMSPAQETHDVTFYNVLTSLWNVIVFVMTPTQAATND